MIAALARSLSSSSSSLKNKENRFINTTATSSSSSVSSDASSVNASDATTTTMNHHHHHLPTNVTVVTLFTKAQCTLCDQVKDVLRQVRHTHPHVLWQQDITDDIVVVPNDPSYDQDLPDSDDQHTTTDHGGWYDQYKYDIPVLHINGWYWCKHRLTTEQAQEGLTRAQQGLFTQAQPGQPHAAHYERRRRQKRERAQPQQQPHDNSTKEE